MNTDPERPGGLLAWQWANYPGGHRNRVNLAVHIATAPLYLLGVVAVVTAPLTGWWPALAGLGAMGSTMFLQGRGHRLEAARPRPFRGPSDVAVRLFVEQWVTFPRYVLSGGFGRAWREATPVGRPG